MQKETTASTSTPDARAQQVRRVRMDVQRARAVQQAGGNAGLHTPWNSSAVQARDLGPISQQRFFPANEHGFDHTGQPVQNDTSSAPSASGAAVWQTDNLVHSVVRAVPASNLVRETMAAPTIDAWPRKQNKISSLSQKPSDAEHIPPLMRQLNKLVWEGLRTVGIIVDRCVTEYKGHGAEVSTGRGRKELLHDITEIFDPGAAASSAASDAAFSQLSSARLVTEVVHRFMDNILLVERTATSDPGELEDNRRELADDNRRAERVASDLGAAVARWSIFEQAGAVFSKCFATYEAAIGEVMKECADCVDDVLNVLVKEIVALRGRLAESRSEIRNHEHQMAQVRRERDDAQKQCSEANEAARDALVRIAQRDKDNKRLGYDVEDRDKTIQRQLDEMDLMSKQYNVQETKIHKLSSQVARAREQIDSLTMKVADLKRSLAQSESVASTCAVETLQLRQQLVTVNSAFLQLRAEGKVPEGEPKPKFVTGGSLMNDQQQQPQLQQQPASPVSPKKTQRGSVSASSASALPGAAAFAVINYNINEWMEIAFRGYRAEIDARLSEYTATPGDPTDATGAFSHWRASLQAGLAQLASSPSLANSISVNPSSNLSTVGSTTTSIHFPEIKPRNTNASLFVSVADDLSRPFFVGMGEGSHVPSALKFVGKIPNMKLGVDTVSNMIVAFFRDTAENIPKHILVETLDPVHQMGVTGPGSVTREDYESKVRRTLAADGKSLNPVGGAAGAGSPTSAEPEQQQQPKKTATPAAATSTDGAVAVGSEHTLQFGADTKTLVHLLSQWLSFTLDCNDDATPALYNILYSSRWHSYAPVCRFFDAAVRFDAPGALWFAIADTIQLFKTTLENSVTDVFAVAESSVQEAVKKTFSTSLNNAAITRISIVVHQFFQDAVATAEQDAMNRIAVVAQSTGAGSPNSNTLRSMPSVSNINPDITLRSLFVSGIEFAKRKHRRMVHSRANKEATTCTALWAADSVDESPIVQAIRNECIVAWFDLVAELSESVLDRAIVSPEGHVTAYSLAGAILHVDPLRPRSSMDKIVRTIFGAERPRPPRPESPPNALAESNALLGLDPLGDASASGGDQQDQSLMSGIGGLSERPASGASLLSVESSAAAGSTPTTAKQQEDKKPKQKKRNENGYTSDDDDDDGGASAASRGNYADRYRSRLYTNDMVLVNEALTRLRFIPLARYTPPQEGQNAE